MGVRGLTTYIERNKDKYLKNYNLRDTHLVIDGNSLCAQLYKFYAKCNDEFGGDYDKFAKCIETFFAMLKQCNVSPIVILDGGYEWKKIRTVNFRLKSKLKLIRNINPASSTWATIFPLFYREVFKDVVIKLNIPLVRCDFEADLEIACVARKLKCPVLSYDSDFFIFDTLYIPFNSMDFYTTKIKDGRGSNHCICCKIYNIEVFLKRCKLDKSLVPLMATLLGNDYIKKSLFRKFYNHIKLPKKNGSRSDQHRTIIALINWLQNETFDSAVRKVLGRLKTNERQKLAKEIKNVTEGYISSYSELFEYLGLTQNEEEPADKIREINTDDIISEDEEGDENKSDDSDSSATESDSEDDADVVVEFSDDLDPNVIYTTHLQWFRNNVRNCTFPTLFIDILSLNMGIYLPQIEDTTNINSFNIFVPLLQSISKILLQNNITSFSYLGRNEYSDTKRYRFEVSDLQLPSIFDIESLDNNQCSLYFMETVNFSKNDFNEILQLPEQWQLYLLSVVYWVKNAVNPKITYCHLSSLILCMLHLSIVDEKIPNMREKNYFIKKYGTKLKSALETRKQMKNDKSKTMESDVANFSQETDLLNAIKAVDVDDCLFFIDILVSNFKIQEKMKSNKNMYSIHIVDAFAQFQSCLLHIKYLNALFKFPLPSFDISKLFNGTYIYNMYLNLKSRNDIDVYIELILKNSPSLLLIYKQIITHLNNLVELSPALGTRKKRKRKKKNTTTEKDEETNKNMSESDGECLLDDNNKFSLLALV